MSDDDDIASQYVVHSVDRHGSAVCRRRCWLNHMELVMKDAEDEAFDDLAQRQGDWGGGYRAKRAAAADKLHWSDCAVHNGPAYPAGPCDCGPTQPWQEPHGYDWSMLEAAQESLREHMARIKELEAQLAQPAQEPVARVTGVYGGRFTYEPLNPSMILPVGMALYAGPA